MNDTGIAYLPVQPERAVSALGRAFDGVTPRTLAFVFALALAYAMTRLVNQFVVAIVDGHAHRWAWEALLEFSCYTTIAALMFSSVVIAGNLGPQSGWRRIAALGGAAAAAALASVAVRVFWLLHVHDGVPAEAVGFAGKLRQEGISYFFLTAMLLIVAAIYKRERASLASTHRATLDRNNLERQMAQARVQVLQAQIEPHFLFNTLANVRRLYETDRDAGDRMLENLMRYLEVALPQMRDESSTLGREIALIDSYLNVQQIRIGRRLKFSIEVAPSLKAMPLPPMMLLTLVENAIKHGISPLPAGGEIRVRAEMREGRLVLSVADTGRGLAGTGGVGTGLANIRARLAAAYGDAAALVITGNEPAGIVARLTIPSALPG